MTHFNDVSYGNKLNIINSIHEPNNTKIYNGTLTTVLSEHISAQDILNKYNKDKGAYLSNVFLQAFNAVSANNEPDLE